MKINKTDDFTKQWAIKYLTGRYYAQELHLHFGLQTYITANLGYVLANIKNGLCKQWNREIEGRLI